MAYSAACLFVPFAREVVGVVRRTLPELDIRLFSGVLGTLPTDLGEPGLIGCARATCYTHEESDESWKNYDDFEKHHAELMSAGMAVSCAIPKTPVLVLRVDCGGGWDFCRAVVYEDGRVVFDRTANLDPDAYARAIDEAVGLLGVRLDGGYFPPLVRGAFDRCGRPCV